MGGKCPSYMVVILLFVYIISVVHDCRKRLGRFGCGACGLILFGRSINWGVHIFQRTTHSLSSNFRDPDRNINTVTSFSKWLRKEIIFRIQNETILVWTFALVVITFFISDGVEHHQYFSGFFYMIIFIDLVEELYEIPFMVGLSVLFMI
jgi:hypothetical protein